MQLQYNDLNEVPEDLRESYVEFEEGESKVFVHKDLAEFKKETFKKIGDMDKLQSANMSMAEKLKAYEEAEKQRKLEAEKRQLEGMKDKGQHEEILEHFKAQAEKEKQELAAKIEEMQNSIREEKKNSLVKELSSLATDGNKVALERLVSLDIDFDESGQPVFLDNGKATSQTFEQYKANLRNLYPSLVGEVHGRGGQANGGTGSVAVSEVNKKAEAAKKKGDVKAFLDASIKF